MYDVINMPDLIVRYFSSTPWLVIFIVSTIYLFFRLNNARKRAMLFAVIVFFLFVNALVIKVFTRLGQNSTYYRHLWAIPSIAVIGIAAIDLVKSIPRWYLKIPMIVALAIGLWFVNGQEYIRCRVQILSANGKLVPEDIIEIGDKLEEIRKESGKNTLFVICPNGYERPYGNMVTELGLYSGGIRVADSSILNDSNHNGEAELNSENPDVEHIMSSCSANGIDYVIVMGKEGVEQKFKELGNEPILRTNKILLYKCKGYEGYVQDLDNWGQIRSRTWHDKDGKLMLNEDGYCIIRFKYDKSGKLIEESYYDVDENLLCDKWGYAIAKSVYDNRGNISEYRLYDEKEMPCSHATSGWSIIRFFWNEKNLMIRKCYYDVNDEPMEDYASGLGMPHSFEEYSYDKKGDKISERLLSVSGMPAQTIYGYDEIRYVYDEYHHVIRQSYYSYGEKVNRTDSGFAEISFEYNDAGIIVNTQYFDRDGNIIILVPCNI